MRRSCQILFRVASLLTVSVACLAQCLAQATPRDRIASPIDTSQMVTLKGNVHPKARPQYDRGLVEPTLTLPYITLLLKPTARQQAALKQLLTEQQNPSSPNYRKWLTPEQYADRFGLNQNDIEKVVGWLEGEGFNVVQTARGRNWIAFSGTAEQVQKTFRTEIHRYYVDNEMHIANATEPSVPKALAGVVGGFRGLDDFRLKPMHLKSPLLHSMILPHLPGPDYTVGSSHFLAPDDLATIYDITPLYNGGFNGTGQSLVIVGQSDITLTDIQNFRTGFNLPTNNPQITLVPGSPDPGHTGDEVEADLDLEWSGAVARNANIIYVNAAPSTGGVINSAQYAIDNKLAPVISMSFVLCEKAVGSASIASFEAELQKANSEGITFLASSGDSGAAACDASGSAGATQGLAVSYPASSPEVTAVGGSEFNEGGLTTYWNGSNGPNGGSATSYIPEMGWNDTLFGATPALASTGGGASSCVTVNGGGTCTAGFPKPPWQAGTGVPADNVRDVPDLSLSASAAHDGYILCTKGSCASGIQNGSIIGGTSASAPVFAAMVSLLNQYLVATGVQTTPGLANINPTLYQLAQGSNAANIFHDITTGNNIVPCQTGTPSCPTGAPFQFGYSAGPGYDLVTGWGSVDASNMVTGWSGKIASSTTLTSSATQVNVGTSGTFTAKVSAFAGSGTPSGTATFSNGSTALGTGTLDSTGKATFTTSTLAAGTYSVTAVYSGDSHFNTSTSSPLAFAVIDFTFTPATATISVARGQSGQSTLTITPEGGFNQTVSFSCSGLPSESTCNFSPTGVTPSGVAVTTTVTIQTTAPSAQLNHRHAGRGGEVFYALLIPGFMGLVVLAGNRKRTFRSVRFLGLVAVLLFSTLWMACGGGSSTPRNPGTPAGNSTVTVTATGSGTTPLTHQMTITLNVQ